MISQLDNSIIFTMLSGIVVLNDGELGLADVALVINSAIVLL